MKLWDRKGKYCRRKKLPVATYLVYLLIATFLFTGVSFSKYATTASGSDEARVAAFDFEFTLTGAGSLAEVLAVDTYPGMKATYTIQVTDASEVAVKYKVTAENLTDNTPLTATLMDGNTAYDGHYLTAGEDGTRELTLTLNWDGNNNAAVYAGEVDAIRITVTAEQID
ncbi:MAG: hypothetical protein U0L15_09630 [Oscillospiraceae bacterium]|nr:hypothetical protein [Oscillospiraceae bacterium]